MQLILIVDILPLTVLGIEKSVNDNLVVTYLSSTNEEEGLKLFSIISIVGAACIVFLACSENQSMDKGQLEKKEKQAVAEAATKAPEKPSEVDGIITYTEKGLAVVTESDLFLVMGQDLAEMVGKKVKITGAIAEVDENQVIQVMSVMPIK